MVSHSGGYHGVPFKGYRGVIQGGLLLPTIFNVVLDSLVKHWILIVEDGEAGLEV